MGFLAAIYGLIWYAVFLGSFLYAVGFIGAIIATQTIDSGPTGPTAESLMVNPVLLGLFAMQHSVMARPGFKTVSTRIVLSSVERST